MRKPLVKEVTSLDSLPPSPKNLSRGLTGIQPTVTEESGTPKSPLSRNQPKSYRRAANSGQNSPKHTSPRVMSSRALSIRQDSVAVPIADSSIFVGPPLVIDSTPSSPSPLSALPSWVRGEEIGRGSMGTVYQGMIRATGSMIAVKEIFIVSEEDAAMSSKLMQEVETLRTLDHPHIVRLLGFELKKESLEIFLEYVPGGSLSGVIRRFGALGQTLTRTYAEQILSGLSYLHAKQIIHRDLKAANVLISSEGRAKLADFGCSKKLSKLEATLGEKTILAQTLVGSVPWMAPELISQSGYTTKADIWSFGCLLIEMISGKPPWGDHDNNLATMLAIATSHNGPQLPVKDGEDNELTAQFKEFIESCLIRDPFKRPTAQALRRHAFLIT